MSTEQQTDVSEKRPYRRTLPHEPPSWIDPANEVFFVTLCCQRRGHNQLCHDAIAASLIETARFYQEKQRWFVHLMLLMPDHLHLLLSFPPSESLQKVVSAWKRYAAKKLRLEWQRDFFDHRLRRDESFREKADYILQNPVRAGLVETDAAWPFVLFG